MIGSSSREDLRVLVDEKFPMTWPCEAQKNSPGLHPKQPVQLGKGGDPVPLLCSGLTPPPNSKDGRDTDLLNQAQRRDRKVIKRVPSSKSYSMVE